VENFLHFDLGGIVTFVLGGLISVGVYYVRTSVQLAGLKQVGQAEDRLEQLGSRMLERIDGVRDAVNSLNVTIGRADERLIQAEKHLVILDSRVETCEKRWASVLEAPRSRRRTKKAAAV
jgi:hypothetical protein